MANAGPELEPEEDLEVPPARPWGRPARDMAACIWPSFLAACLGTLLCFGLVDPASLGEAMSPAREISRMTAYGLGFFFFWIIALASSVLTIFLVRTGSGRSGQATAMDGDE